MMLISYGGRAVSRGTSSTFAVFAVVMILASATAGAATPAKPGASTPVLVGAASIPAGAAVSTLAAPARLIAADSEVAFTARQLNVPLDGRFKRFDAQIALDPRQPGAGKIAFQVELASVAINTETDAELTLAPWFNTAKFPRASFVSSAIKPAGPGRFNVSGTLSIKGQLRELVVPVFLKQVGGVTTATGAFALRRLDFNIGDGDWADTSVVANDVQVRFKLALQGLAPL